MTDLDALADRVERLVRPDRELDGEIAATLGWEKCPNPTHAGGLIDLWRSGAGDWQRWHVPAYTTSLDAAMTLIPEGFCWSLEDLIGKRESVRMWDDAQTVDVLCSGNSPALALVAASLRAHATLNRARDEARRAVR